MYRSILIIWCLFLLVGCSSEDDVQRLRAELEMMNQSFQVELDQTNQEIAQLKGDLELKDLKIRKQEAAMDDLTKRLMTFEDDLTNVQLTLMSLESQAYYNDYLTAFLNDIVRALESYSTIRGMIVEYNPQEKILVLDELEYVAYYDDERIQALNIDTENEPIISGAYIYNSPEDHRVLKTHDTVKIYLHRDDDPGYMINGSVQDLILMMQEEPGLSYTLHLVNGVVISITEDFHN